MNLGFQSASAFVAGIGLVGFVLWLAFIATASVWLPRQPARVRQSPLEPALQEA